MAHEYTMEWIYHFTCSECMNWWSYPTMELRLAIMHKRITCPHCSFTDRAQPKVDDFQDRPA
jgi:hypothetical protein